VGLGMGGGMLASRLCSMVRHRQAAEVGIRCVVGVV